ncbi:MAG: HEAT repeat domain-containing protein [Planctomycetota bacterium]
MKISRIVLSLLFLLLFILHVSADTVTLKNGGKLHGKVIMETEKEVVIEVAGSGTITIPKKDYISVEKNEKDAEIPKTSWVTEDKPTEPQKEPAETTPGEEPLKPEEKPISPELKAKIDELIFQLSHRKASWRSNAKAELAKIGKPAVDALIIALKQGTLWQRQAAADLLGTIGDKKAIEPLIGALSDQDTLVCKGAVSSLSSLTNQDFAVDHKSPPAERQEAVDKWKKWLEKKKQEEEESKNPPQQPEEDEGTEEPDENLD